MDSIHMMPRKHKHKANGKDKYNQDLKMEFSKEKETLNKTQAEMRNELKNPVAQLEISKESLISWMNQAKDKLLGLKNRVEHLDEIIEYGK